MKLKPILTQLTSGSFVYENKSGKTIKILKLDMINTNGTPNVLIKINGSYMTLDSLTQSNPTPFPLAVSFSYNASNDCQALDLLDGGNLEIIYTSGTGQINLFILMSD